MFCRKKEKMNPITLFVFDFVSFLERKTKRSMGISCALLSFEYANFGKNCRCFDGFGWVNWWCNWTFSCFYHDENSNYRENQENLFHLSSAQILLQHNRTTTNYRIVRITWQRISNKNKCNMMCMRNLTSKSSSEKVSHLSNVNCCKFLFSTFIHCLDYEISSLSSDFCCLSFSSEIS